MIHHDSRDYNVAASEAATKGRVKMEEIIHNGIASATATIEAIANRVLSDKVVRAPGITIVPKGFGWDLGLSGPGIHHPLHDHAFAQVTENVGVPRKFVNDLEGEVEGDGENADRWGKALVAHNVNTILSHRVKQRNLLRIEGDTVKGFLSDKFRRLDSRPLLESFISRCQEMGLVPIQGVHSDTKCRVRAVMPHVFEPVANEVMIFGVEWGNSDFGDGGHVVNLWTMRVWCTNLAVTDKCLRQIHLGGRLSEDISYSERTYQLDTKANASALKDIVSNAISPKRVNGMLEAIKNASEKDITGKDGIDAILKKFLDKNDILKVKGLYDGPDVVNLPAGNNLWRLSNAVSWLAQDKGMSADRKLELQTVAGNLIPHKAADALAI